MTPNNYVNIHIVTSFPGMGGRAKKESTDRACTDYLAYLVIY